MSRAAILANVRSGLKVEARQDAERRASVEARLEQGGAHLVPARGKVGTEERVALFKSFLAAQGTDVIEVAVDAEIPGAIAGYLRARTLPARMRTGTDPFLASLPWTDDITRATGAAQADDTAGLSRAIAGVAETGTLVLASGPDNPTTLALLPETHLVVVRRERIVGSYEDAVTLAAAELGSGVLPHTLNLVSGASRTGDIGGRIVVGAHGPRRLAVILVGPVGASSTPT
jgi:L-lactate dehydrogenase complex protein LldG